MARPAVLTVADTIARSFLKSVEVRGDRPAIREKKFGIWQPTSWREWLQISKDIAFGLHASGFRPGEVASIIANAVPEWVYADMGILCAGGVSSGIYPTDSSVQVEYLINDSSTKVIFAEDEEQLDKILSCRSRCPTLQKIVVFDMEGLSAFSDPMLLSLDEFMALGRNASQGNEAQWDAMVGSRGADDLAILFLLNLGIWIRWVSLLRQIRGHTRLELFDLSLMTLGFFGLLRLSLDWALDCWFEFLAGLEVDMRIK